MHKTILTMLALVCATFFASLSVFAADAADRREAARLAARRAEEATNRASVDGTPPPAVAAPAAAPSAPPAQPAAASRPPAVDATHVEVVKPGAVALHGAADLVGKRYALREIDGKKVAGGADAFIEWRTETSMTGRLCNIFHATSTFESSVVKAEELPATTKMACNDEEMGALEKRLFPALRLGMSFLAIGDSLELRRDDLLLRFAVTKDEPAKKTEERTEKKEEGKTEEKIVLPPPPAAGSDDADKAEEADEEPLVSELLISEEVLAGRKFVLLKVDGKDFTLTSANRPYIEFGEGMRVGGSACNNFTGLGELTDGVLKVPHAVATRKMCIDANVSEFERYFHEMLRKGVEIVVDGGTLLLAGDGRTLEFVEE